MTVFEQARDIVNFLGLLIAMFCGAAAILSPAWVWLRHQILTILSTALAGMGALLLGSFSFQTMEIEIPGANLILTELYNIEEKIASIADYNVRTAANMSSRINALEENAIRFEWADNEMQRRTGIQSTQNSALSAYEIINDSNIGLNPYILPSGRILRYGEFKEMLQDKNFSEKEVQQILNTLSNAISVTPYLGYQTPDAADSAAEAAED